MKINSPNCFFGQCQALSVCDVNPTMYPLVLLILIDGSAYKTDNKIYWQIWKFVFVKNSVRVLTPPPSLPYSLFIFKIGGGGSFDYIAYFRLGCVKLRLDCPAGLKWPAGARIFLKFSIRKKLDNT